MDVLARIANYFQEKSAFDNKECLRIVSGGQNKSTEVFTPGGEEVKNITSIEIDRIDCESGILHAVIRCEVRLG